MTRRWTTILLVGGVLGCREKAEGIAPATRPSARTPVFEMPSAPEALRFGRREGTQGFGLPSGCRIDLPVRGAAIGSADARFLAPETMASELVFTTSATRPHRSGIVSLGGPGPPRPFPWLDLDAPPPAARFTTGWLAVLPGDGSGDLQSVSLWTEGRGLVPLAQGDQLTAWDAACAGDDCAILTTRVGKSAAGGATVMLGNATSQPSTWKHVDVTPPGESRWEPFSLLRTGRDQAEIVLETEGLAETWQVSPTVTKRGARFVVEHALYDVVLASPPVAVLAGAPVDEPCTKDGFEMIFQRPTGTPTKITIPVPPDGLVTRRIQGGFLMAWVAPLSCRLTDRSMVHALRLDRNGMPASSAMAVAPASGFALSTRGSSIDLWVHRGEELLWVTGTCESTAEPPASASPPAAPSGSAFNSPP